jgi:hypothetical protein
MKKTTLIILSGILAISLVFGLTPRQDKDCEYYGMHHNYGKGYHMSDEFYEEHEELFEKNSDKIEAIHEDIEDLHTNLEAELEKESPSWDKVAKLMQKQHNLRNKIWKIRNEEKLTVLKSLEPEEREEFANKYCLGGHMGPANHHDYDEQQRPRGHHRGHMRR